MAKDFEIYPPTSAEALVNRIMFCVKEDIRKGLPADASQPFMLDWARAYGLHELANGVNRGVATMTAERDQARQKCLDLYIARDEARDLAYEDAAKIMDADSMTGDRMADYWAERHAELIREHAKLIKQAQPQP